MLEVQYIQISSSDLKPNALKLSWIKKFNACIKINDSNDWTKIYAYKHKISSTQNCGKATEMKDHLLWECNKYDEQTT